MTLNINFQERELLLELLTTKRDSILHELHHTDTNDYKVLLKQKLKVLEEIESKIMNLEAGSTVAGGL